MIPERKLKKRDLSKPVEIPSGEGNTGVYPKQDLVRALKAYPATAAKIQARIDATRTNGSSDPASGGGSVYRRHKVKFPSPKRK